MEGKKYLESDKAFPPGANSRQVDLSEGLVGEPHVHALLRDGELEGNRLVGFGHDDWKRRQGQERKQGRTRRKTGRIRLLFMKLSASRPTPTGPTQQVNPEQQERLSGGNGSGGNANDMQIAPALFTCANV